MSFKKIVQNKWHVDNIIVISFNMNRGVGMNSKVWGQSLRVDRKVGDKLCFSAYVQIT